MAPDVIIMESIAKRLEAGTYRPRLPAAPVPAPPQSLLRDIAFALPRVAILFGALVALYGVTP
jgi:hypothetical protein